MLSDPMHKGKDAKLQSMEGQYKRVAWAPQALGASTDEASDCATTVSCASDLPEGELNHGFPRRNAIDTPVWEGYFEKQHLAMCGMHALNNALGGQLHRVEDLHRACTWYLRLVRSLGALSWCLPLAFALGACTWCLHLAHAKQRKTTPNLEPHK